LTYKIRRIIMTFMNGEFTLSELARQTDTEPRTIRSYIAEGLLRGPEAVGRNARYSRHHYDRLCAIRVLRDQERLGLGEIRRRFLTLTDEEIASIGARLHGAESAARAVAPSASALDYIRGLRVKLKAEQQTSPIGWTFAERPGDAMSLREDHLPWGVSSGRDHAAPDIAPHVGRAKSPGKGATFAAMSVESQGVPDRFKELLQQYDDRKEDHSRDNPREDRRMRELVDLCAEVAAVREREQQIRDTLARTQSELERLRRAFEAATVPILALDQANADAQPFVRISVLSGVEIIVCGVRDAEKLKLIREHAEKLKRDLLRESNNDR
jgi:DNA-binding transcriptional MerR regulator